MPHYKYPMFIPGKGTAWTYTEADEQDRVLRTLTHVPATGEVSRIPDPVVKALFMKERLTPCPAEEFQALWDLPGGA